MSVLGKLELQGVENVLANLDRVTRKMEDASRKALDAQGEAFVADVVANTPVVSGAAAGSVRKSAATSKEVEVSAGGSDAPYFPLIEWGGVHNRQPTAPFRRALEERRYRMLPETAAAIKGDVPDLK